jgi:aspartyl aminopeptidase
MVMGLAYISASGSMAEAFVDLLSSSPSNRHTVANFQDALEHRMNQSNATNTKHVGRATIAI